MVCGIVGIGTYIPNNYLTAKELSDISKIPENIIVEKFGIKKKIIPGDNDTTCKMAINAAMNAIQNAEINPIDIDLVLWVGDQQKDYPSWVASNKIAENIGAKNSVGIDISSMCGSMLSGIEIAMSMLIANKKYKTVLLVSGSRLCDLVNLELPETAFMMNFGAGGAAIIIQKDYNQNVILGSSFLSDSSLSDQCVIEYGGTKNWPIKEEHLKKMHFTIKDSLKFKELMDATSSNFEIVIKEALLNSHININSIDYLAILHMKRSTHKSILEKFNLDESKTTYLEQYGHVGQNDQILSLELGLNSGKIKNGNIVVLVGAGLGFIWGATVIKWGKYVV